MSKRIHSSRLRTLKDVKRAQRHVAKKRSDVEDRMLDDYEDLSGIVSEVTSVDYWLDMVLSRVPQLIPVVQSAHAAYAFVSTLFGKR